MDTRESWIQAQNNVNTFSGHYNPNQNDIDPEAPYRFAAEGRLEELIICRQTMTLDADRLWKIATEMNQPLITGYLYAVMDKRPIPRTGLMDLSRDLHRKMALDHPEIYNPLVRTNKVLRDTLYEPYVRDVMKQARLFKTNIKPTKSEEFPGIKQYDIVMIEYYYKVIVKGKRTNKIELVRDHYVYMGDNMFDRIDIDIGGNDEMNIFFDFTPDFSEYWKPYRWNHIFPNSKIYFNVAPDEIIDKYDHKLTGKKIIDGLEWTVINDDDKSDEFLYIDTSRDNEQTRTLRVWGLF